ncbi:hypothetical protein EDB89DRAFT_574860 [Lactarius sanguifluus]|nr:hypothetical protein EDB89DRAFT_574860 [Lactarius sanguifluus]
MTQGHCSERVSAQGGSHRSATTIKLLPDNVLLEIFDFYRSQTYTHQSELHLVSRALVWPWHLLVHVCRRWRQVIFESPHRLDLQILCTRRTPVKKNLSLWPAFPIVITYRLPERNKRPLGQGNVIDALKHPDRISYVSLDVTAVQLGKMAMVMRKPFPVLTSLTILLKDTNESVLPARFLGGSAPRLQEFILSGVPYPTLPTLLLSASGLVSLQLFNIPPTDFISPTVMAASLAALPRLKFLYTFFQSATPPPDQIHPPPITRAVLPALTEFHFKGASEYLEDLVSRIDGPQLYQISTAYLNQQLVDIQVPRLSEFINRTVGPELGQYKFALVTFYSGVAFYVGRHASPKHLIWNSIFDKVTDWQLSRIAQALSQISPALSNVVHLKFAELDEGRHLYGIDGVEWPHLLYQFPTAQTLHAYPKLAGYIALALEDIVGEMVTEVLLSLDLICLEDQPASSIEKNGVQ